MPLAQTGPSAFGDLATRPEPGYLTESEMRRSERENLLAVLKKTSWKIEGADGAAELIGVKPNAPRTRIKEMGLKRPLAIGVVR